MKKDLIEGKLYQITGRFSDKKIASVNLYSILQNTSIL